LRLVSDLVDALKDSPAPSDAHDMGGRALAPATVGDLLAVLNEFPASAIKRLGVITNIRACLIRKGKQLSADRASKWMQLLFPDAVQGASGLELGRLRLEFEHLWKNSASDDRTPWQRLSHTLQLLEAGNGGSAQPYPAETMSYLSKNRNHVLSFFSHTLLLPETPKRASKSMGVHRSAGTAMFERHASDIKQLIQLWSQRGLPTHWTDIAALLKQLGECPTHSDLQSLPLALPGYAKEGRWFFLETERPKKFQKHTGFFRGAPPHAHPPPAPTHEKIHAEDSSSDDEEHSVGVGTVREGLCSALIHRYPNGFTQQNFCDVLAQQCPERTRSLNETHMRNLQAAGTLVAVGSGLFTVDPDILVAPQRERLLAGLPDRASWVSTYFANDRDLQDSLHNSDEETASASRQESKTKWLRPVSESVPLRIATFLQSLEEKELEKYVRADSSVKGNWNFQKLTPVLRAKLPGLKLCEIDEFLRATSPAELKTVIEQPSQKPRQPWAGRDLPQLCRDAHARQSLSLHLPLADFASFIDEWNPDRVLRPTRLSDRMKSTRSNDIEPARQALQEMARNGELWRFTRTGVPLEFDPVSVVLFLMHKDIHVTRLVAEKLLEAFKPMPNDDQWISKMTAGEHYLKAARQVIHQLRLQPGQSIPEGDAFREAFEKAVCTGEGGKRLFYHGYDAFQVWLTAESLLADSTPATKRPADSSDDRPAKARAPVKRKLADPSHDVVSSTRENPYVQGSTTEILLASGVFGATTESRYDFMPALQQAGLAVRATPGGGDCLYYALHHDEFPAPSTIDAMRHALADLLAHEPDTPFTLNRNALSFANHRLQQLDTSRLGGVGDDLIREMTNAELAAMEARPGTYSDPDIALPLYCRRCDSLASPGSTPTTVALLSQDDGHIIIYSANRRIVVKADAPLLPETLKYQLETANAVILQRSAHFERIVPGAATGS
jgi:hypothetical protein